MTVKTGLDVVAKESLASIKGANVGFLGNQASIDSSFSHAVDVLAKDSSFKLSKIFAPEHGFRGELQDMETIESTRDSRTGCEIVSLYGNSEASLRPRPEDLEGLSAIIVDLQDIGARYYTYAQSLGYLMQSVAETDIKIVVLDRPNPLNGETIEGAPLTKPCRSFCGYTPVPQRHGLTMGELAIMMQKGFGEGEDAIPPIDCDLEVVKLQGWNRSEFYDETGVPWVFPSPNMPTLETAIVYPGMCLFEATEISEARGTTKPFELIGAPYVEGYDWVEKTLSLIPEDSGFALRPTSFVPKFQKHANKHCGGFQIHVTDRKSFRSYRLALALIYAAHELYPDVFSWRHQAYEFVDNVPAIDLLHGSDSFRKAVETNSGLAALFKEMTTFEKQFAEARKPFLIY